MPETEVTEKCIRCGTVDPFDARGRCVECGVHKDRPVQKKRSRKIGGKRGRNSGKVSQHGKK